jgi:hypothetical protein
LSPNYNYVKIGYAGVGLDIVTLGAAKVCVLPFETDSSGKTIHDLYLLRYYDFVRDSARLSAMMYNFNDATDESNLDTAMRCVRETMQLAVSQKELNRVFYVGEIELNQIMSGSLPCYAINVTGMTKQGEARYEVNKELNIYLEKVQYVNTLKGMSQDCLVASATFLLLSYMA